MNEMRKELRIKLLETFTAYMENAFENNGDELSESQVKQIISALIDNFICSIESFTHQLAGKISKDIFLETIKRAVVNELDELKKKEYD